MDSSSLGYNLQFPIYKEDGTLFEGLVLYKSTFDSVVMSLATKITGDVYYRTNNLNVTMREYIVYNDVKYTLVNPPTIVREGLVKDNSELKGMTKYSFEFYHPMYQLSNMPFCDVAVSSDDKRYLSENKSFAWIGYPIDFLNKLNKNLEGTQWVCELSSSITEEKLNELSSVISFSNNTIADAIKAWYDTWQLPYVIDQLNEGDEGYSQNKRFKIVLGYPSNEIYRYYDGQPTGIPYVFHIGQGVGLKNNSRTPRNNKIVTRISGYGSEDNIPYGYPQIVWTGDQTWDYTINNDPLNVLSYPIYDGIVNGENVRLIKHPFTRTNLMPSIYRECVDRKVNPYNPNYNPNTNIIDYYDAIGSEYGNQINPLAPSYESHQFEGLKPELGEAVLVDAYPLTKDLERDTEWDDSIDGDGNYIQSFFNVTLPQLEFDIYACAAITQSMKINMRSGDCLGCTFEIQADWEAYKQNFYDSDGNFAPYGEQRNFTLFPDSRLGEIDVILKKENETFGTVMPNRYQKVKGGDQFVIIGISLPLSYVTDAEERLDEEMKSYMKLNNIYYFDYPLKFDEAFLANNPHILSQIHLNTSVRFMFNETELQLFVKQITIKYGNTPLPEYNITLTDNIEVSSSPLGQVSDSVDKLAALIAQVRRNGSGSGSGSGGSGDSSDKLSRMVDDEARGTIGFINGAWFGLRSWFIDKFGNANFNNTVVNGLLKAYNSIINTVRSANYSGEGMLDTGWMVTDSYGGRNSKAIFDYLYIRKKALFEKLELRAISHIGGDFALSPASGKAYRVEYYDADNNILGEEEISVPWRLGTSIMMLFSKSAANKYLGRRKRVNRALKTGEKPDEVDETKLVKRIRVYLFSDDGSTKTMSNWTVGAQARCQTFNIEEQMEYHGSGEDSDNPDVTFWTGDKVKNTYWWRLVSAVGKGTLSDGKTHDYIEFLANTGNDYNVADTGSDLPAVGDEFAQFGHRTRPELANIIMLETARGDSPAIKLYTNVNSWDLTGKRVSCISPEMTEFVSNRFRLTTDYEGDAQLNDRGLWVDIPEPRKCYYNDIVSHKGKWWLCIVAKGYHKEDELGHWYTQEELDELMISDPIKYGSLVWRENYTTLEPSDETIEQQMVWVEKTDYLVQIARLVFSNPMFVGSGQFTSTVTLMVSNVPATIDSVTVDDSYGEVTWNGSQLVCNATGSNPNRKVKVTAHGIMNNMTYTASDVVCVYQVASSYSVSALPSSFAFRQNENAPYSMNVDGVEEIDGVMGNSCTQISVTDGNGNLQPFRITKVTSIGYEDSEGQIETSGVSCTYNNVTGRAWFVLVSNKAVKGSMTITISYGNNQTQNIVVPFASSLNGTWITEIENDVKTDVATKMTFDICDETGQVIKTTTLAEYTRSSSEDSAKLTKTTEYQTGQLSGNNPSGLNTKITTTNERIDNSDKSVQKLTRTVTGAQGEKYTNTRIDTAESSIRSINGVVYNSDGSVAVVKHSEFTMTDSGFTFMNKQMASTGYASGQATSAANGVEKKLKETGIIIDGDNREVKLIAGKVSFCDSSGSKQSYVQITNDGKIKATDVDLSGKITATKGKIGGFLIDGNNLIGESNAYIRAWVDGYQYAILGDSDAELSVRNDRGKGVYIYTQGSNSVGLQIDTGVGSGKAIEVIRGNVSFGGDLSVGGSLIASGSTKTGSGSYSLPTNPTEGQIVFVKGTSGGITVRGSYSHMIMHADSHDTSLTLDIGDKSTIFVCMNDYWVQFYCG